MAQEFLADRASVSNYFWSMVVILESLQVVGVFQFLEANVACGFLVFHFSLNQIKSIWLSHTYD